MKIINKKMMLCHDCMEEHIVQYVQIKEKNIFKNIDVTYEANYLYCSNSDSLMADEKMIKQNNLAMKDAYRKNVGLLTSTDIITIRKKYHISTKDFAKILGWGDTTIIRYENHQVQDQVHDDLLSEINKNPELFLEKVQKAKGVISEKAFKKYAENVSTIIYTNRNNHLINLIKAYYIHIDKSKFMGNSNLQLNKVIETINYFAMNVNHLHKVKLMKMLWYADFLYYKENNYSLTGLAYGAMKYGALPLASEHIVHLKGISMNEEVCNGYLSYHFEAPIDFKCKLLTSNECVFLDKIINLFKDYSSEQIITKMHSEKAYIETKKGELIDYSFSKLLTI